MSHSISPTISTEEPMPNRPDVFRDALRWRLAWTARRVGEGAGTNSGEISRADRDGPLAGACLPLRPDARRYSLAPRLVPSPLPSVTGT